MVNAFFESNDNLIADEERKAFAKDPIKELKFLYSNTDSEDPNVWIAFSHLYIIHWAMFQLFKGLFCGPLVLHTFAAHFIAIGGTVKVAGLKDGPAWGGLCLTSALVITHFLMHELILTVIRPIEASHYGQWVPLHCKWCLTSRPPN